MVNVEEKIEPKKLTTEEVKVMVDESYKSIIENLTHKMQLVDESQRWLVMARIINMCFRHFYLTTIKSAENVYPDYRENN